LPLLPVNAYISQNWRGKPLLTRAAIVSLIGSTKTATGLEVYSYLDEKAYAAQIQVTDEQMKSINIRPGRFHGEWNYTIKPKLSSAALLDGRGRHSDQAS
jgi:hypothetical protein